MKEMPRTSEREVSDYIGDGVYVGWDGYQIWLRTPRPIEMPDGTIGAQVWHEIAIDSYTWDALVRFRNRVTTKGR